MLPHSCKNWDFEKPVKDKLFQWEADDIANEIASMLSERDRHFVKGRALRPGDIKLSPEELSGLNAQKLTDMALEKALEILR